MPKLKEAVVHLTRDGIWPWGIPCDPGDPWPAGVSAHTRFMNSSGAVIADIVAAEVTEDLVRFLAQPEDVAAIPAGAKFETFLDTVQGPLKIRYGTVMRPEAMFFDSPGRQAEARKLVDNFQRSKLGFRWENVRAGAKIYNNQAQSLPYGVGPNVGLFSNQPAAIRYYQQLGGDSFEIGFTITMPSAFGASNGKTTVLGCADHGFTTGLGVEIDSINDKLTLVRPTSPTTVVYLTAPLANVPASADNYRLRYNDLTKELAMYKGASLEPLDDPWVDSTDLVPHGNGYRYTGFMFKPTFLETGPQISGWAAKDDV
ncbi:hypothetical protein A5717_25950 [Mycolicibacterium porcinum]|uniref:LtfC-like domain-containing protein n=1 Tax=Mycolicibacterium porcinum TaxID=39693 RepID=UPI00080BF67D|nr:hypothetical protein [Mycolicibacterium porcinum]OCB09221.1 hypothetical protein A5717_25950 [Mycolicibacterium porcinum]